MSGDVVQVFGEVLSSQWPIILAGALLALGVVFVIMRMQS